ncbi:MAG: PqqD family protein [Nitrospira sp.]|jgi:predicted Mrr-cat superfamily restriction endonuclease|nr:PqqD family protein [Nitrospira sp.]MDI3462862.1 hypothetical protein [Nitrospira sp.]
MTRLKKSSYVMTDEVDGATMLCNTKTVEFFRLNTTAAQVWRLCEGSDLDNLVKRLHAMYPQENSKALRDTVEKFVESLKLADLIELRKV